MFAVYADRPSPDDPLAALVVGEREEPVAPRGWVTVRVKAASLNMHDLWTLRGVGIKPEQFPMILGCDGAGELEDGTEVVLHSVIAAPAGWATRRWTRGAPCSPRSTRAPSPIWSPCPRATCCPNRPG